jgi:hypothetical protein
MRLDLKLQNEPNLIERTSIFTRKFGEPAHQYGKSVNLTAAVQNNEFQMQRVKFWNLRKLQI